MIVLERWKMKKTLEQELASLRRDIKSLTEQFAEVVGDSYESVRDEAEEYVEGVGDEMRTKWTQAKEYGRKSRQYVEEHPWQSIGTGVAIGFLIGFLARRRD